MDQELREKRKKLICELVEEPAYVPMKVKELAVFMQVKSEEDKAELASILQELVSEGKLTRTVKGKYVKGNGTICIGTFIAHPRGFGFVQVEGREEDLFIPPDYVNGALHKDIVKVAILPKQRGVREEAEVTEIITRGYTQIVGTYQPCKNYGFVIPDDPKYPCDIFIAKGNDMGAVDGHKVLADIIDFCDGRKGNMNPEGKVVEILGHVNDPGVDILSIVRSFDLPEEFDEKVLEQAQRVAKPVSDADREGRTDLRDVQMVTIDGEDSKDLDDAVSVTFEDGIYHLGVHIADVANYVQERSLLDREALKRGNSVYLVDRVIPMLPHVLCNGICSLNHGEDRLALSCLMDFDEKGNMTDYQIAETVIRVDRRMTYTKVTEILDDPEGEAAQEYAELVPMFLEMAKLAEILKAKRFQRGAVDFDLKESKITLDKAGVPVKIEPYPRNRAMELIEDFMLAANETVSSHFFWQDLPFLYRVHEKPDQEKIKKLRLTLAGMGYTLKTGQEDVHPKELQRLLQKISGSEDEAFVSRMVLRSMKQARYDTECVGHFGLALSQYSHFTSPIRRYPDLQIHRIIKDQLRGRLTAEKADHYRQILPQVATATSATERRADEAERETEKVKKALYMESRIGETYTGVISGVTGFGIFVELPNTVEGLISLDRLGNDDYHYDQDHMVLTGCRTGKTFSLGQTMTVTVYDADHATGRVDFSI
ncbi:MAG: ribonuclease R [Lachnospiraceae bacterium]|nr:ribonuclease R [Lachnospiraceae bacterium]